MIEDVRAALLGDHEAAKRLTEAGVLVPCMCGGKAGIVCFEKRGACLEIWDIWHQLNAGIAGWN